MGAKKTSGRLPEVFIDRLRDNTLQGLGDLVGTGGLLHAAADALHAPHRLLRGHALQQGGHALEISIAAPSAFTDRITPSSTWMVNLRAHTPFGI